MFGAAGLLLSDCVFSDLSVSARLFSVRLLRCVVGRSFFTPSSAFSPFSFCGTTGLPEAVFASPSWAGWTVSSSTVPLGRQTSMRVSFCSAGFFAGGSVLPEFRVLNTPATRAATATKLTRKNARIKCLGLSWKRDYI